MSVFTPTRQNERQSKIHYSQYIKTENKPDEAEAKPTEPATPGQPETK